MAFSVFHTRGERLSNDNYDDSYQVAVKEFGVLEVTKDGEQVKLYSPNYWAYVIPRESEKGGGAWVLP